MNSLATGESMASSLGATLESMGLRCHQSLYGDNQAANHIADSRATWRTRALSNKVHAFRSRRERGLLNLQYVQSAEMRADGLTKAGGPTFYKRIREHFGLEAQELSMALIALLRARQ